MALKQFRQPWFLALALGVPLICAGTLSVAYVDVFLRPDAYADHGAEAPPVVLMEPMGTPFIVPGLERPPAVPAAQVDLPDDAEVIGVFVAGKARAYRREAFHAMSNHVVNDLIDDVPVTVTYCNRTDCVQVFTEDKRGQTLDVMTGGFLGQLMLRGKDGFFWQRTGKLTNPERAEVQSYPTLPFTRTTWKAWRQRYPECDVYLGQ